MLQKFVEEKCYELITYHRNQVQLQSQQLQPSINLPCHSSSSLYSKRSLDEVSSFGSNSFMSQIKKNNLLYEVSHQSFENKNIQLYDMVFDFYMDEVVEKDHEDEHFYGFFHK